MVKRDGGKRQTETFLKLSLGAIMLCSIEIVNSCLSETETGDHDRERPKHWIYRNSFSTRIRVLTLK